MKKHLFIALLVSLLSSNFYFSAEAMPPPKKTSRKQPEVHNKRKHAEESSENTQTTTSRAGIQNIGNTCYMNASIQCLTTLQPLQELLIENENLYKAGSTPLSYLNLTKDLHTAQQVIDPNYFNIKRITIGTFGQQQDAHEFITNLFDNHLLKDTNFHQQTDATNLNKKIKELMYLDCVKSIECPELECQHISTDKSSDLFLQLSLGQERSSLKDLINKYFSQETLTEENKVKCNQCGKQVQATLYNKIEKLPKVLMIQFERFKSIGNVVSKINTPISFPLTNLDMQDYLTAEAKEQHENTKYDLVGFVIHDNNSLERGHYFSYIKNNGNWLLANDNNVALNQDQYVKIISEKGFFGAPYILFYQLKENNEDEEIAETQEQENDGTLDEETEETIGQRKPKRKHSKRTKTILLKTLKQLKKQNKASKTMQENLNDSNQKLGQAFLDILKSVQESQQSSRYEPPKFYQEPKENSFDPNALERIKNGEKNLQGVNLRKADLSNLDLKDVDLSGAYLEFAKLNGADLTRAKLIGTHLERAELNDAILIEADLSRAFLDHAKLNKANLTSAKLIEAKLTNFKLNEGILTSANLSGASLINSRNLQKIRIDGDANLKNTIMESLDFEQALLKDIDFTESKLSKILFKDSELENINMKEIKAYQLTFDGSKLSNIKFEEANLDYLEMKNMCYLGNKLNFYKANMNKCLFVGDLISNSDIYWINLLPYYSDEEQAATIRDKEIKLQTPGIEIDLTHYFASAIPYMAHSKCGYAGVGILTGLTGLVLWIPANLLMYHGTKVIKKCEDYFDCFYTYENINSFIENSNFEETKISESCFSNIKFKNCQGLNKLRGAEGVLFNNVRFSIKITTYFYEETEKELIETLKEQGAKVTGSNKSNSVAMKNINQWPKEVSIIESLLS